MLVAEGAVAAVVATATAGLDREAALVGMKAWVATGMGEVAGVVRALVVDEAAAAAAGKVIQEAWTRAAAAVAGVDVD